MLDVRRMRVLREVALRGSIAGAAESLSFTPSAVSQQVAKLERETGIALVRRGPRSVTLTEAGRRLVEHTEDILERLAEAEADVRRLAGENASLRVGSITTAAAAILPAALKSFGRRLPETPVTVLEADSLEGLARVRARELDLAIVFEYDHVPLPVDERIELLHLLEESMRVLLPEGHRVARQRAVRLPDLAGERWIQSTTRSSCRPFTERACRAAGFEPEIVAQFDDYTVLQNAVAAGVGVGFAPDMGLSRLSPGVVVRPIAFAAPHRRVLVAVRRGEAEQPAIAAMLEALHEAVAAREPLFPALAGAS
jgi:DNA-binding transcriptional LysR family regulator